MNIQKFAVVTASLLLVAGASFWGYAIAAGDEISVCVSKSGSVHVVGPDFKSSDCKKNETLLTWNIVGPKGDKGDTGEQGIQGPVGPKGDTGEQGPAGLTGPQGARGEKGENGERGVPGQNGVSARHGAGNIAFCSNAYPSCLTVLRTDGTVWDKGDNGTWAPHYSQPDSVPIPTSDIVVWEQNSFLDTNGDVWSWSQSKGWVNGGHP